MDAQVDPRAQGLGHEQEARLGLCHEQRPARAPPQHRDVRAVIGDHFEQRPARREVRLLRRVEHRVALLEAAEALVEEGRQLAARGLRLVELQRGLEQQQPLQHRHAELLRVLLEARSRVALDLLRHLLEREQREAEDGDQRASEHQEEDAPRDAAGEEAPHQPALLASLLHVVGLVLRGQAEIGAVVASDDIVEADRIGNAGLR